MGLGKKKVSLGENKIKFRTRGSEVTYGRDIIKSPYSTKNLKK
jgi:hypothetical protein